MPIYSKLFRAEMAARRKVGTKLPNSGEFNRRWEVWPAEQYAKIRLSTSDLDIAVETKKLSALPRLAANEADADLPNFNR